MSRLVVSRTGVAKIWDNVARLQQAAGDRDAATQSRKAAVIVRSNSAWINRHGLAWPR